MISSPQTKSNGSQSRGNNHRGIVRETLDTIIFLNSIQGGKLGEHQLGTDFKGIGQYVDEYSYYE